MTTSRHRDTHKPQRLISHTHMIDGTAKPVHVVFGVYILMVIFYPGMNTAVVRSQWLHRGSISRLYTWIIGL